MQREQAVKFLRENPVFWSRLGFCYDPHRYDENGETIVFSKNFSDFSTVHDMFSDAGIRVHTCILHSGWVGVNKYDYTLCDKVLETLFASGKSEYFIPRIKLNVPVDWCAEYPAEVCVYDNGPRDEEEIKELVGTEKHDWIGYDSEIGYYNANGWQDDRPNVGGTIALQSFSSKKWLSDAGEALTRLIDHIENSQYGNKIIAYHIAFGTSGESMLWGRTTGKFADYGISNKKHFLDYLVKKYGSKEAVASILGEDAIKEIIPYPELRQTKEYRDETDRWSIDYDLFVGEVTTDAIMYFADIVHSKTNKPFGTFYGYILHMPRAAYTGHLSFKRLLDSGKIDFFAAPKSYRRSAPGEPGGEMAPTVSVNATSLWLDECDNRTHLSSDTIGGVAANAEETYAVQLREFCKNISHNSGLWYMDLGGNWYNDSGIMKNIEKIVTANNKLRKMPHESVAEIAIIVDENAVLKGHPNHVLKTEEFIRELQLCGAHIDIIFSHDVGSLNLKNIKLAVLLTPYYITDSETAYLKKQISEKGKLLFVGKTNCNTEGEFTVEVETLYTELRKLVEAAGVNCIAPENSAVYADNRIVSIFPREDMTFVPNLPKDKKITDIFSGEPYEYGSPISVKAKMAKAFIIE